MTVNGGVRVPRVDFLISGRRLRATDRSIVAIDIARGHEAVANASGTGGQLVRQCFGQAVLRPIAGQIGERQHHDGDTGGRGLG